MKTEDKEEREGEKERSKRVESVEISTIYK